MNTDLVVTTCERLDLLKQTLEHIWERTSTPHNLHIIDDASTEGNIEFVRALAREGKIHSGILRLEREGIPANLRTALLVTESDPVVITDDDILCPKLDPDWLWRGLEAMKADPKLGILALNNPQANVGDKERRANRRKAREVVGKVTYCRNVGGTFAFVRREVLRDFSPPDGTVSSFKEMCIRSKRGGWEVGYLTDVYCQHIGVESIRMGHPIHDRFSKVPPLSSETLIPIKKFRR